MGDLLLPQGTRLVHIGPHKTGSTSVQVALDDRREHLAAQGVRYAGPARRPSKAGRSIGLGGRRGPTVPSIQHWHRLVAEV